MYFFLSFEYKIDQFCTQVIKTFDKLEQVRYNLRSPKFNEVWT